MRYLLNEAEYAAYQEALERVKALPTTAELQEACTQIACDMPISGWHAEHNGQRIDHPNGWRAPWGCILSTDGGMGYCDDCPVSGICPNKYKEWSK